MRIYSGKPGIGINGEIDRREILFISNKKINKVNNSSYNVEDDLISKLYDSHGEGETMPTLNEKQKTVLLRGAKSLGALLIAGAFAWVAGPDGAELVGLQTQALIVAVLTPTIQMILKSVQYGQDVGENPELSVFQLGPDKREEIPGEEEDNNH